MSYMVSDIQCRARLQVATPLRRIHPVTTRKQYEPPRLSGKENVILSLLSDHDELYGLDMVSKSKELKRGTIYVTLDRLEERGLVSSREEETPPGARGPARRMYRITGLGQSVLNAYQAYLSACRGFVPGAAF
jgi:PadR family transcriptional regulator PadR